MEIIMKIELKKINFDARATEETNCFSASLYVNGEEIGIVSNKGRGGCDWFSGDQEKYDAADKWCKANIPPRKFYGQEQPSDLESYYNELLEDHLVRKEVKKLMKSRILFVNEAGELREAGYKGVRKIEQMHIDYFKSRNPGQKILNELPEDEAFQIFKEKTAAPEEDSVMKPGM